MYLIHRFGETLPITARLCSRKGGILLGLLPRTDTETSENGGCQMRPIWYNSNAKPAYDARIAAFTDGSRGQVRVRLTKGSEGYLSTCLPLVHQTLQPAFVLSGRRVAGSRFLINPAVSYVLVWSYIAGRFPGAITLPKALASNSFPPAKRYSLNTSSGDPLGS